MSTTNIHTLPFQDSAITQTVIPTQWIGPVSFKFQGNTEQIPVPLATYETTLWPSTNRGAKVTRLAGGITTSLIHDTMSRSIILRAPSAQEAGEISHLIEKEYPLLKILISQSSQYAVLQDIHIEVCGKNLYSDRIYESC